MAEKFFNDKEDLDWLKEVHIESLLKSKSALLIGNEDFPDQIVLYRRANPDHDEKPVALITFADDYGNL